MRVIHVLRKPLSEGTVAANVLEHGTGAINVNASRIASPGETITNHSRGDDSAISKGIYGDSKGQETHQTEGQKRGRWPGNLILEHDEECRFVGTKRVRGTSIHGESTATRRSGVHEDAGGHQSAGRVQPVRGYSDPDGSEVIASWDCVEGCPVAALDVQSGGVGASAPVRGTEASPAVRAGDVYSARRRVPGPFHNDKGGASRFFKQVGGDE